MAGNHPSELSPRQRMINMMYLVLTALLALNVSKEVLQSFFDVNQGITRTTKSFNAKNGDVYTAFDNAVLQNPKKAGPFQKQANLVKDEADALIAFIQEMKYNLVLKADGKVYLGSDSDFLDEEGDFIDGTETMETWEELGDDQKEMSIGYLNAKDDRNSSGDLFWHENRPENENVSTDLKKKMLVYRDFLTSLAEGNPNLQESINKVFKLEGKLGKKKNESWEKYNFHDMPAVGALTLLSKMQADVRNTEGDIINMLKENIEANSLKFTSAEGIAVQNSNFLLRGDEFSAEIFLAAKDTTQAPKIYIGKYKDLGKGQYEMIGTEGKDYKVVEVVNGKGVYKTKTSSIGEKTWGGLIVLKVKDGEKMYPFENQYLVAAKGAVASPTKMNVLYRGLSNPVKVSVAGYPPSQVSAKCSNGSMSTVSKGKGEYVIKPTKLTKCTVTLYVTRDGKRTQMGSIDFRVKKVPDPVVKVKGKIDGSFTRDGLIAAQGISAGMKDFDFKGVKYAVTSYDVIANYKGNQTTFSVRGGGFSSKVNKAIQATASGNSITFANIKVKLKIKCEKTRKMGGLTFKIK